MATVKEQIALMDLALTNPFLTIEQIDEIYNNYIIAGGSDNDNIEEQEVLLYILTTQFENYIINHLKLEIANMGLALIEPLTLTEEQINNIYNKYISLTGKIDNDNLKLTQAFNEFYTEYLETQFQILLNEKLNQLNYAKYQLLKIKIYADINSGNKFQLYRIEQTLQALQDIKDKNLANNSIMSKNGWVVFKNIPLTELFSETKNVIKDLKTIQSEIEILLNKVKNDISLATTKEDLELIDTSINIFNAINGISNGEIVILISAPSLVVESNETNAIDLTNNQALLIEYLSK